MSQTPWIENASFRDNTLFCLLLDERRYRGTVHACTLDLDLEHLVDSDHAELGVNCVDLSSGDMCEMSGEKEALRDVVCTPKKMILE